MNFENYLEHLRKEILDLQSQKPEHGSMRKVSDTFPIPKLAIHEFHSVGVESDAKDLISNNDGRNDSMNETKDVANNSVQESNNAIAGEIIKSADTVESDEVKDSAVINTTTSDEEKKENIVIQKIEPCAMSDDDSEKVLIPADDSLVNDNHDNHDDDLHEFEDAREDGIISNTEALKIFKKLLSLKGSVGISLDANNAIEGNDSQEGNTTPTTDNSIIQTPVPSATQPSRIVNGRKVRRHFDTCIQCFVSLRKTNDTICFFGLAN